MDCLLRRNGIRKTDNGINSVIDSNDKCLDRANGNLMEMDGRKRNPLSLKTVQTGQTPVPSGGWHERQSPGQPTKGELVLCASTGTIRPQVYFKDKVLSYIHYSLSLESSEKKNYLSVPIMPMYLYSFLLTGVMWLLSFNDAINYSTFFYLQCLII